MHCGSAHSACLVHLGSGVQLESPTCIEISQLEAITSLWSEFIIAAYRMLNNYRPFSPLQVACFENVGLVGFWGCTQKHAAFARLMRGVQLLRCPMSKRILWYMLELEQCTPTLWAIVGRKVIYRLQKVGSFQLLDLLWKVFILVGAGFVSMQPKSVFCIVHKSKAFIGAEQLQSDQELADRSLDSPRPDQPGVRVLRNGTAD